MLHRMGIYAHADSVVSFTFQRPRETEGGVTEFSRHSLYYKTSFFNKCVSVSFTRFKTTSGMHQESGREQVQLMRIDDFLSPAGLN